MAVVKESEKNGSSIDLLWNHSFHIIDDWYEQENFQEDVLLQSSKQLAENVKQNQTNVSDLINQMTKELFEWEEISREELLTSIAVLQNLFPFKSFEEINNQLDHFKNQTSEFLTSSLNNLLKGKYTDTILSTIDNHIEIRRNIRNLYVENVKETFSIFETNQRTFLNFLTSPIKNGFFLPF